MPSSKSRYTTATTKWTDFEKRTFLSLMARGVHLVAPSRRRKERKDLAAARKNHAYLTFATELNLALNKSDVESDINIKDVKQMIDRMLIEKKGLLGKGGYMERAGQGRITRSLKRIWDREPGFDYNGSLGEWDSWRKSAEAKKRSGVKPVENDGVLESIEGNYRSTPSPPIGQDRIWRQAELAAANGRGQWQNGKNGHNIHANMSQPGTSAVVDRAFGSATTTKVHSQSFGSSINTRGHASSSAGAGASFPHPPGAVNAYTSGPPGYSGPHASFYTQVPPPTLPGLSNQFNDSILFANSSTSKTEVKSSDLKKPGVLKHAKKFSIEAINPARKAMMESEESDESGDASNGNIVEGTNHLDERVNSRKRSSGGNGADNANNEKLPFNRLERS